MKEEELMKRVLNTALKFSPLVYVLLGATGTYYSLKGDLDNAKRTIEEHCRSFSHESWVSGDRLLHPALRGSIQLLLEQQLKERDERLRSEHRLWPCELDAERRWDRLYDKNPTLSR